MTAAAAARSAASTAATDYGWKKNRHAAPGSGDRSSRGAAQGRPGGGLDRQPKL